MTYFANTQCKNACLGGECLSPQQHRDPLIPQTWPGILPAPSLHHCLGCPSFSHLRVPLPYPRAALPFPICPMSLCPMSPCPQGLVLPTKSIQCPQQTQSEDVALERLSSAHLGGCAEVGDPPSCSQPRAWRLQPLSRAFPCRECGPDRGWEREASPGAGSSPPQPLSPLSCRRGTAGVPSSARTTKPTTSGSWE